MSKTYATQRAYTARQEQPNTTSALREGGDVRKLRARLKVQTRRNERHALPDAWAVLDGDGPPPPHRVAPALWQSPRARRG